MAGASPPTRPPADTSSPTWPPSGPVHPAFGPGGGISRRRLLTAGGALGVSLACAACAPGRSKAPTAIKAPTLSEPELRGDLRMVALAASLENLAVGLYDQAQHALANGRLGPGEPALTTLVLSVQEQHADHAKSWNTVLVGARRARVTGPDPVFKPQTDKAFAQVGDVGGLVALLLMVEVTMAATQLQALGTMAGTDALGIAATVYPVEMQHGAMLRFLIGQYPVPDTFARPNLARPDTDYQG